MSKLLETLLHIKESIEREFGLKPSKKVRSKRGNFYGLRYDRQCSEIYIMFGNKDIILLEQRLHAVDKDKTFVDRSLRKEIPLNEIIPNFELLLAIDDICIKIDKGLIEMPDTSGKVLAEFRKSQEKRKNK